MMIILLILFWSVTVVLGQNCQTVDAKCAHCTYRGINNLECTVCHDSYFLTEQKQCMKCQVENCISCPGNKCRTCIDGFRNVYWSSASDAPVQYCQQCNAQFCGKCETSLNKCSSCPWGRGFNSNQQCVTCLVERCVLCAQSYDICTRCRNGFGLDKVNNLCPKCFDDNCLRCDINYQRCTLCTNGTGVKDGLCVKCNQTDCLQCPKNYSVCEKCTERNALMAPYCFKCDDHSCSSCPTDNQKCEECDEGKGVSNTSTCISCSNNCLECRRNNAYQCTSCHQGMFLNETQDYSCELCSYYMDHCLLCKNSSFCNKCADAFYLNQSKQSCQKCPEECTLCQWNTNGQRVECAKCIEFFQLNADLECIDICGDGITINNPCDLRLGVPLDGCTDLCEVEENFTCKVVNNNRTICSYKEQLDIKVVEVERNHLTNVLHLTIILSPYLDVFLSHDVSTFVSTSTENVVIHSLVYNKRDKSIEVEVELQRTFAEEKVEFVFSPPKEDDERFFATPVSKAYLNIDSFEHYFPFSLEIQTFLEAALLLTVGMSWMGILLSFPAKSLSGVQSYVCVQLTYTVFLFMDTPLHQPLEVLSSLQFVNFYADSHFADYFSSAKERMLWKEIVYKDNVESTFPHIKKFGLTSASFMNNFNFAILLQMIPLLSLIVLVPITFYLKRELTRNEVNADQGDAHVDKLREKYKIALNRISQAKEICSTVLMTFTSTNVCPFATALFLFFSNTQTQHSSSISELVFIGLCSAMFVLTLVFLYFDPDPFDYFRYSFRSERLALCHFLIFILCEIVTAVTVFVFPIKVWASLIPFSLLLLFTLIYRPFKYFKENVHSCVVIGVTLLVLGFRLLLFFSEGSTNNRNTYIYILAVTLSLMCLSISTVAFCIYKTVFLCYILPRMKKGEKEKIVMEISDITVRQKLKYVSNEESIFKELIRKQMSILNFSERMNFLGSQNSSKDEGNFLTTFGSAPFDKYANEELKSRRLRKELFENDGIQFQSSRNTPTDDKEYFDDFYKEAQKINQNVEQNFQKYLKAKQMHNTFDENIDKEEAKKNYILEIMTEENKFIRMKNVEQHFNQQSSMRMKDSQQFISQYDKIND